MTDPTHLDRITVDQLDRHLRGVATPDEDARVGAWMHAHPEARAFVERVASVGVDDLDAAWAAIVRRIADADGRAFGTPREDRLGLASPVDLGGPTRTFVSVPFSGRGVRSWATRVSWLGGALATVVAGVLLVTRGSTFRSPVLSEHVPVYTTTTGQRAVITLRDGTRVYLAPRTSLRLAAFDANSRTVTLDGQAYFEVGTASSRPFIVRTGAVTTRVLGTAFTVIHYAGASEVRVAVRSGKVAVDAGQRMVLGAGEIARFTDSTATLLPDAALQDYTEWAGGQLVFTRAPVRDVLTVLEQWYGLEFRLTDPSIAAQHVTVAFDKSSRADVLQMLKSLLNVEMTFDGMTVTVTPRTTRGRQPTVRGDEERVFSHTKEVGR